MINSSCNLNSFQKEHRSIIDDILTPLFKGFNIKNFIYADLLTGKNKALFLSNKDIVTENLIGIGEFSECFYKSLEKSETNSSYSFLWPQQPNDKVGLSLKSLDLTNGLTIIQKSKNSIETWAFIGNQDDTELHDLFLNRTEILHHFIKRFREKFQKTLNKTTLPYTTFKTTKYIEVSHDIGSKVVNFKRESGIKRHYLSGDFSDIYITNRELDCISLLSKNKSYKEIGASLNITYSCVKKHIDSIKLKTGIMQKSILIQILKSTGTI